MPKLPKTSRANIHPGMQPGAIAAIAAIEWLPIRRRAISPAVNRRLLAIAHVARLAQSIERASARFLSL